MTDRKVLLRYSRDGGHNWSGWRQRSLGAMGEYERRVQLPRNGSYGQLGVRPSLTSRWELSDA